MILIDQLINVFAQQADYRVAHREAAQLMEKSDSLIDLVHQGIKDAIVKSNFLDKTRDYPTITVPLEKNRYFELVANCWLPHPDNEKTISFQNIHHHGDLLLTSKNIFGPGYWSHLFNKDFHIEGNEVSGLKITKSYRNEPANIEFVDSWQPHIVYYPKELSTTLALWSKERESSLSKLRSNKIVQKNKKIIKKILQKTPFVQSKINSAQLYDFYPENNKIVALDERKHYSVGSTDNFAQSLCHIMQRTGFPSEGLVGLKELFYQSGHEDLFRKLNQRDSIEGHFEENHVAVPYLNFEKTDIERIVPKI